MMTATYIRKNSEDYAPFVGDVEQFVTNEVEPINVECDEPQISAITKYFDVGVEINKITMTGQIDVVNHPEEGYTGFRSILLY